MMTWDDDERHERARRAFANWLAKWCRRYSDWFAEAERQLACCPECGENLYYGKPCPQYRDDAEHVDTIRMVH